MSKFIFFHITYGNLTYNQILKANNVNSSYQNIINEFTKEKYEYPSIEKSKIEIQNLIPLVNKQVKNPIRRYKDQDENLFNYLKSETQKLNIVSDKFILAILRYLESDINPIILNLKQYWNRGRPNTYAYNLNLPLYPLNAKSADTPSYPSGHSLQAGVWADAILRFKGNNANIIKRVRNIYKDISNARLNLGVHFESDIKFSEIITSYIVENPKYLQFNKQLSYL
jgi:hypothetical protein